MTQSRRPSPLQRRVLIVLAALDEKRPGPVLTRDLERVLERSGEAPVYGPNLRASCRRLEDAGWLRTLRAPNLQLAVELTDAGRAVHSLCCWQNRTAPGQNSVRQKSSYCRWSRQQVCPQAALLPLIWRWS